MEVVGTGRSDLRREREREGKRARERVQRLGANIGAHGTFSNSDPASAACA